MLPREWMLAHGAKQLSDDELLRVLLGSGTQTVPLAQTIMELLRRYPQLTQLTEVSVDELMAVPGLGLGKAALLSAAVEFGRRVLVRQTFRRGQITSVLAVGEKMCVRMAGLSQEVVLALLLDVKHAVITEVEIGRGGVNESIADPRVVYREALLANAANLILVHNHPSGDPSPSAADIAMTKRFEKAGTLVGVQLLDHLVIGGTRYYSFHAAHRV